MKSMKEFKRLLESQTEKSNAAQALRGIGEKCQKIATDLSNIKLKDLNAVIKTLKLNADNELADIQNVQTTVSEYLDQMINTCMEASSKIDDLSYEIMGDLKISDSNLEKVEDELGLDDEELDLDSEDSLDSDEDEELDLDNAGGRELK